MNISIVSYKKFNKTPFKKPITHILPTIKKANADIPTSALNLWCGIKELNLHEKFSLDPKSSASANSANPAWGE